MSAAPPLILASASPRRQRLLAEAGIPFVVHPADIDEQPITGEKPEQAVLRLAAAKARHVADCHPGQLVLGADTLVAIDGQTLGKPDSLAEARAMLAALAGRWHAVFTGVSLCRRPGNEQAWCCRTDIRFRDLDEAAISRYLALVNPLDKAGAYGIQEHGGLLVAERRGLLSNVIGLPVEELRLRLTPLLEDKP